MIIIGCSASKDLAKKISKKLKKPYSELFVSKFPDNELYVRFKTNVKNKTVVLVQSLFEPNEKIIEILFAAYTAKDLGAKKLVLVAPYLAYMRQDKRFHPSGCISSEVIAKLFRVFDELITIDPHLHRHHSLRKLFKIKSKKLSANSLIADYIKKHFKNSIILGPDEESYQWAKKVAEKIKSHAIVLKKRRYTSRKVRIKIKGMNLKGKNIVVVDDIISTGHTMMETVKEAKHLGAKKIECVCVHGIFAENAYEKLKKLGVKRIVSTNTIPNKAAKIDVSGLIADSLK